MLKHFDCVSGAVISKIIWIKPVDEGQECMFRRDFVKSGRVLPIRIVRIEVRSPAFLWNDERI